MTRWDVVGRDAETSTQCMSCRQSYQGADLAMRCRINGLLTSKANADDCKRYERENGSDDWLTIPLCGGCRK